MQPLIDDTLLATVYGGILLGVGLRPYYKRRWLFGWHGDSSYTWLTGRRVLSVGQVVSLL